MRLVTRAKNIDWWFALIMILALLLGLRGFGWGLPSAERNELYFSSVEEIDAHASQTTREMAVNSMSGWPGKPEVDRPPRNFYNPLRPFNADEHLVTKAISNMEPERLDFNPNFYMYGGAYVYVIALFLFLSTRLGIVTLSHDIGQYFLHPEEIAKVYLVGRSYSLLLYLGLVWLTYRIGRKIGDKHLGRQAAAFLAAVPIVAIYSHLQLPEVPLGFWTILTFFLALSIQEKGTWGSYIATGAAAGMAMGTKLSAVPILLVIPLFHFFGYWHSRREKSGKDQVWSLKKLAVSLLFVPLVFLLTNPYAILDWENFRYNLTSLPRWQVPFLQGVDFYRRALVYGLRWPLMLLAVLGTVTAIVRRKRIQLVLVAMLLVYLSALARATDLLLHYTISFMPFLTLLAACFLSFLIKRFPSRWGSLAAAILFWASLAATAFGSLGYINLMAQENTRMAAGRWMATQIPEGARVGTVNVPWSYQLPPFNERKLETVIVGDKVSGLREKLPDYFLASELQWRGIDWRSFQPCLSGRPYKLHKQFRAYPNVFGLTFDRDNHYLDMINISPPIHIYKQTSLARPGEEVF